jgi:hypothetical protein
VEEGIWKVNFGVVQGETIIYKNKTITVGWYIGKLKSMTVTTVGWYNFCDENRMDAVKKNFLGYPQPYTHL